MSTAHATRIFGIKIGVDPKILIGVLIVLAGLLFWYNSRSDDESAIGAPPRAAVAGNAGSKAVGERKPVPRRSTGQGINDRGILRMRAVDPTKGDVDPTLHLDLLSRLSVVSEGKIGRSVFESGPSAESIAAAAAIKGPKIPVSPITQVPVAPPVTVTPEINVPFKYYGYAKPEEKAEANRGLFLDDTENVLVASEGQTVKGHYLVVELTPKSARIEDTNVRQGKTIPVAPMAQQQ